jgi:hypothetical protein
MLCDEYDSREVKIHTRPNIHLLQVRLHHAIFSHKLSSLHTSLRAPCFHFYFWSLFCFSDSFPFLLFTPPYPSIFVFSFFSFFILQGMPLPFPFVDNYADLESEALLVLEPAKKSIARNNKNEELNVMNNENDNILNLNIIQTVQSVLQNPLSSLSEFNWRGERILEQLEKHKVSISSIFALHYFFYVSPSSLISLSQLRY